MQSEGHLAKNSMLNLALNLSNLGTGSGNWLVFIKFSLHNYLLQSIPTNNHSYPLRKPLNIPHYYCRIDKSKNSFFSNVINEWSKLDKKIKGATSFFLFKASLLEIGHPHENSTHRIHNPVGIRLLTRLRLGLSHLNEQKFRNNFADCANPLCSCIIKPETKIHFFSALSQLLKD